MRWAGMPFLALKAKAFSKARQGVPVIMSEEFWVESMPLWHNALFVDESHYTYFSPALVRQGVLYASQVLQHGSLQDDVVLPPFFRSVYMRVSGLVQNARQLRCPRPSFSAVGMWSSWFTLAMLEYLNRQTMPEQR